MGQRKVDGVIEFLGRISLICYHFFQMDSNFNRKMQEKEFFGSKRGSKSRSVKD